MAKRKRKKGGTILYLKRNYDIYLLLIPALIFVFIFNLLPMLGLTIAFKDYNMFLRVDGELIGPARAIFESPSAGLKYFEKVFGSPGFWQAFRNTLIISVSKIVFVFPLPIIFAIFLNEVPSLRFQRSLQRVVYLPHFLSWVVVSGIFISILNSTGLINNFLSIFGAGPVNFLMDSNKFRSILVVSDAWKTVGWSSIIYFSAITGLDQELFEAAEVDGASRMQRIRYITIPGLSAIIIMMLILRVGNIMNAGFDQIFVMYSPPVYEVSDIIGTYNYRMSMGRLQFSEGTAVGIFNSVINMALILASNLFARRVTGRSIW